MVGHTLRPAQHVLILALNSQLAEAFANMWIILFQLPRRFCLSRMSPLKLRAILCSNVSGLLALVSIAPLPSNVMTIPS